MQIFFEYKKGYKKVQRNIIKKTKQNYGKGTDRKKDLRNKQRNKENQL
jgi:hypothetical protein